QSADAEGAHSPPDGRSHSAVHILSVTDLSNRRSRNRYDIAFIADEPDLVRVDEQLHTGSGLGVGDGTSVVCDFVTALTREERQRHGKAENNCQELIHSFSLNSEIDGNGPGPGRDDCDAISAAS